MITVRSAKSRRHLKSETQDTWLTFDPGNKADPFRHGFRSLKALNEERPVPAMSLHPQTEEAVEILTYVREGALQNWSSSGEQDPIQIEEFQRSITSRTTRHRFINGSFMSRAHVFQCWITPGGDGVEPGTQQSRFPYADRKGVLRLIASSDARGGTLRIHQDVRVYSSILLVGHHLIHEVGRGRAAWLHVVQGRIHLRDHLLGTGDAAAIEHEEAVSFTAQAPSEILLFDLA